MPRFDSSQRKKDQKELSSAEIRAELEITISETVYARENMNKAMYDLGCTILYRKFHIVQLFIILFDVLEKNLSDYTKRKDATIYNLAPFIITFLIVFFVQLFLLPIMLSTLRNLETHYKVDENSNSLNHLLKKITYTFCNPGFAFIKSVALAPAKKQANNPYEDLNVLLETKENLKKVSTYNTLYLFCVNVMCPCVYLLISLKLVYFSTNEDTLKSIIKDSDRLAACLRMLYQIYREYVNNQKQNAVENLNSVLISTLVKDLPGITLKQGKSQKTLSYLGLLFKIEDFKSKQNFMVHGKEYLLSYKDLFDAVLYCVNLVRSLEIIKLDKHTIILSANMNQKINHTTESLRQKLISYIVCKHNINRIRKEIFPALQNMTSDLPCEWQALEKKDNEGLPSLVFLTDISDLDVQQGNSLYAALKNIYSNQLNIDNQEIIIETKIEDIRPGYKATFRDIKKTFEIVGNDEVPVNETNKSSTPAPAYSFEQSNDSLKTVKRKNLPSAPQQLTNFFSQKKKIEPPTKIEWPNGTVYHYETEIVKAPTDDTRVIPLPCGRNNLMRYNRFLIIDPRLKRRVDNEKLYEKFLACTRKIVGPIKQQGLKRVMVPYVGCDGRQHISEMEGKILGSDARTYLRKFDDSIPDATLFIMDGFDPHPHKK